MKTLVIDAFTCRRYIRTSINRGKIWLVVLSLMTGACSSFATRENASTLFVRLYGDGQINRAYIAFNGAPSGEMWFSSKDGERFNGEYTTIAPEVYHQDLSMFITRIGRTSIVSARPSFVRHPVMSNTDWLPPAAIAGLPWYANTQRW
jgi:hypothetical protein